MKDRKDDYRFSRAEMIERIIEGRREKLRERIKELLTEINLDGPESPSTLSVRLIDMFREVPSFAQIDDLVEILGQADGMEAYSRTIGWTYSTTPLRVCEVAFDAAKARRAEQGIYDLCQPTSCAKPSRPNSL